MTESTASEECLNRVKADLAAAHERIEQLESSHWRCFHCDETFLDAASAEKHFGKSCDDVAVCQIDASKIRKMEDDAEAAEARVRELEGPAEACPYCKGIRGHWLGCSAPVASQDRGGKS